YTRATQLDPRSSRTFYSKGYSFRGKKDFDKAIEEYNWAIRIDPRYAEAFFERAYAWIETRDYDKAVADCTQAIRLKPRPLYHTERASAYRHQGQYDKALEDYTEAIRVDPKYARGHSSRAWLRATCPDARYRNGPQAVADARRACELCQWKDAYVVQALAA